MPQITRLVAGKKNQNRVNIYCDGKFALTLSLDEVVKSGLKKGIELTDDRVRALKKTDDLNWAYTKILNFLSYRPRSEFEVRARLKKYEVIDQSMIAWVIQKLVDNNHLDDLAFARWFVESRTHNRPRSNRHLTAELLAKGISLSVVKQALADTDEDSSLTRLIDKKSSLSRDKLLLFLQRRGFSYAKIKAKLDEMGIKG